MADYRRKVYGCWLGKSIGGTLGGPHEGKMQLLELDFYDPVPTGAIPNDDLDLQLVWLAALRAHGPAVDERVLGDWWLRSLQYPFDEYGIAMWNLARGVEPPISGQFANHFSHCMGAPIRSEIWACVAPACPGLAALYAYCDGCVDHGGEGIYGEMFFAALESAAFVIDDREQLLDLGLEMIPADCRTAGAVRLTRELHAAGADWLTARERILERYGDINFTDAPQNIAFTVLGWLWGENAADGMCKAVNCGYDTDCTGATLGSILGLLHGPEVFEPKWVDPVGDEVVVGWGVHHCEVPRTLQELSDWTLELAHTILEANDAPVRIGEATDLTGLQVDASQPVELQRRLERHDWTLRQEVQATAGATTVWIGLNGPPALAPGEERVIDIRLEGPRQTVELQAGGAFAITPRGGEDGIHRCVVQAGEDIGAAPRHALSVEVGGCSCPFS
ncbi:MAG: ADP-ribosylglycohydrolase family protein, partial [Armatimonadetes bacterium]|nr:ADP-ribosylglycohydrolase family protein [Armatimonadota bacterium]